MNSETVNRIDVDLASVVMAPAVEGALSLIISAVTAKSSSVLKETVGNDIMTQVESIDG